LNIIVTSSWTAAYAQLAGIDEFKILAPSDIQHPSEYELQIEDIKNLREADLIICGGYEIMMERIRTGLQIDPDKILQIKTDYIEDNIAMSVRAIAELTGSGGQAERNLSTLQELFESSRRKIEDAGLAEIPIVAQFFIGPLAQELELNIAGIFGPRQLEAFDIQELMKLDFELILDNAHNPSARPLAESKKDVPVAYLINFPGKGNTKTLEDVIRYNVEMIIKAHRAGR
jgi:hypothetical protein